MSVELHPVSGSLLVRKNVVKLFLGGRYAQIKGPLNHRAGIHEFGVKMVHGASSALRQKKGKGRSAAYEKAATNEAWDPKKTPVKLKPRDR